MTGETIELRILRRAREILTRPEAWTRGAFARRPPRTALEREVALSQTGKLKCDVGSDFADCFCAVGACGRAAYELGVPLEETLATTRLREEIVRRVSGAPGVAFWNDDPGTTHAEVLALFDRVIEREEAKA